MENSFLTQFLLLSPKFGPPIFSTNFTSNKQVGINSSSYPMKFKGKLMNKTWENGKKPNFGPNFGPLGPSLTPLLFFMTFTSTSS